MYRYSIYYMRCIRIGPQVRLQRFSCIYVSLGICKVISIGSYAYRDRNYRYEQECDTGSIL